MIHPPIFSQPAACDGMETNLWYPNPGDAGREAKWICNNRCPVRDECLAYALRWSEDWGIWGGLGPKERAKLRDSAGQSLSPPPVGKGHPITAAQRRRALELTAKGWSISRVAAELGVSLRSISTIRSQARKSA